MVELWKSAWEDMGDDKVGKGLLIAWPTYVTVAAIVAVVQML